MKENDVTLEGGYLLLSEPFMHDPYFKRTVIMLCEHIEDGGTVGFILNRPLDIKVKDALIDFEAIDNELFYGGPVAPDTLHYLHNYGDLIEDSMHISENIYWGGNFDQLGNLLKAGSIDARGIKFFLGYSGWSPGQLKDELTADNWLVTPAKNKYIFENNYKELWKAVLSDMGGQYKEVMNYPEDPMLN